MERSDPAWLSPRLRTWVSALLLIVGAQLWLIVGKGDWGQTLHLRLLLGAIVLALLPPIYRMFYAALDCIRQPSARAATVVAIAIGVIAAFYFPFTGWYQGRSFAPKWQDEMSYLIQIQMLAHGKLWMPKHALADFFDSFQLIVDPVYASMYFPGASLLYVPGIWLGVPYWVVSAVAAGTCVGLVYLIVTDLMDGAAGALAALMLVSVSMFRRMSLLVAGQPAIVMLGLLMTLCWLRWRRRRSAGWAAALGVFSGWAAITRPLDALVFAIPIGIDMLLSLRGSSARRWAGTFACLVAGAAPFLALQIIFNLAVTGSWHRTPFEHYADRDYPGTTLGFHAYDPARRPASPLPQKQKFHDEWTVPAIQKHQWPNLIPYWIGPGMQILLGDTLPQPMMIALLPIGLLGLIGRKRVIFWLTIPLFVGFYSLYTWFFAHYAMIVAPTVLFWALLGARQVEQTWPRARRALGTLLTLALLVLSIVQLAEFNRHIRDEFFDPQGLRDIDSALAKLEHRPAVVLFRVAPGSNPHEEPVYNIDVPWPDDAPVVRAHDLGDRNIDIFRYYAEHQPQRAFYLYDRGDGSLRFLGFAPELARR